MLQILKPKTNQRDSLDFYLACLILIVNLDSVVLVVEDSESNNCFHDFDRIIKTVDLTTQVML